MLHCSIQLQHIPLRETGVKEGEKKHPGFDEGFSQNGIHTMNLT
jgi:hypothetical protein